MVEIKDSVNHRLLNIEAVQQFCYRSKMHCNILSSKNKLKDNIVVGVHMSKKTHRYAAV